MHNQLVGSLASPLKPAMENVNRLVGFAPSHHMRLRGHGSCVSD